MNHINSNVTNLPASCKSAAEHMAKELEREDTYANLTESCCQKISNLEQIIEGETGEKVALVAYKI